MTKIAGSGSISQRHGSADPDLDPPQNVMDPQHWPTGSIFVIQDADSKKTYLRILNTVLTVKLTGKDEPATYFGTRYGTSWTNLKFCYAEEAQKPGSCDT
jgi:hypothetical protein